MTSKVITVADGTGHGVPGAFMSMHGISILNDIVTQRNVSMSGQILSELRTLVKKSLRQTGKYNETKDGMDIALLIVISKLCLSGFGFPNFMSVG